MIWANRDLRGQPGTEEFLMLSHCFSRGTAGEGPRVTATFLSKLCCMHVTHGHAGLPGPFKNLPELLGLRLLGEVSALEAQCFPVPSHPQSYP